jgi:hypothetical protein
MAVPSPHDTKTAFAHPRPHATPTLHATSQQTRHHSSMCPANRTSAFRLLAESYSVMPDNT